MREKGTLIQMHLKRLLPRLEPHERDRFRLTGIAFMCVATAALVSRTAGDALFLSRLGSAPLPFMYIGGALATGLGAYACARAARRFSTATVTVSVASLLIAGNAITYLVFDLFPGASRVSAYLLADLTGRLPILLYWAFASEIFDARESRKLFGLLGAAGTAACLPAGLAVGPLARGFGTEPLVLLVAALTAGFLVSVWTLARRSGIRRTEADPRTLVPANVLSSSRLHRNRQFVFIALLAAATSLVQTLVDYQFKSAFAPLGRSAALAALFGNLYALTSVAALLIQLFLVHRILKRGGVLLSLSVLPGSLILSATGLLATGAHAWVFATKALDVTLTLTLNGTARQMLYRGIRSESRLPARALAEGLYQPLAVGLAGAALALASGVVTLRTAAVATALGSAIWFMLNRKTYRAYVEGLLQSLRARRFEADEEPFSAREPALDSYVRQTLSSGPDEEVIYLAAVLPELGDFADTPELGEALRRKDPRVKVAILDYWRRTALPVDLDPVLSHSDHRSADVRRAAVRTVARSPGHVGWLRERLSDADDGVCAAAAAALVDTGIPDAATAGRVRIEKMVVSESSGVRRSVAGGLGDIRKESVTPWLSRLLDHPDDETLLAALEACRRRPDPGLIPRLIPLLGRRGLAPAASEALVAIGPAAVESLRAILVEPPNGAGRGPAEKLKIPPVLARIGDARGLPALEPLLHDPDPKVRSVALAAYARLARRRYPVAPSPEDLDRLVLLESSRAEARLRTSLALGNDPATRLAREAVEDLLRSHLRNAFLLLDVQLEDVDMMALFSSLMGGSRESRSQALEVLHNVLPETVKSLLLEVLERDGRQEKEAGTDPATVVAALLEDPESEWVVAGALHAAARLSLASCRAGARRSLRHPSPVVRETALFALSRLEDRGGCLEACSSLAEDPDETVRALALQLGRTAPGEA